MLLVNDRTLFNFLIPDLSRPEIRRLGDLFRNYLQAVVASEGFSITARERIQEEYSEVGYARSNDRSVRGSMNDLAFHYKYAVLEAGGVHSHLIPSIISWLNHMPMGAIGHRYPIDALKELYETAT